MNAQSLESGSATVLVIRNCVDSLLGKNKSIELFHALKNLEWDKKYFDVRRQKVLNKHARYNLCFGEKSSESDFTNKAGCVIGYQTIPLLKDIKNRIEGVCTESNLECEGNYYYNAKKCGIGFHGDAERPEGAAA